MDGELGAERDLSERAGGRARSTASIALVALFALGPRSLAHAADPPVHATMTCERVAKPGRIRCDAEARVQGADTLRWGDVELLEVPNFVVPLRGRIGPSDATVREGTMWRWEFAVVARARGTGELKGRARVLVCRGEGCTPYTLPLRTTVRAGEGGDGGAP